MTSQQLLGQAKAGDADAIARLLNLQLNSKGVQAKAQTKADGTLALQLMGPAEANQADIEKYLIAAFKRLAAPSIRRIDLSYGMGNDETQCLWQSRIDLEEAINPAQTQSPPLVAQSSDSQAQAVTTSQKQRYASPLSIWLQWQATSLGAFILISLLNTAITALLAAIFVFPVMQQQEWGSSLSFWILMACSFVAGLVMLLPTCLIMGDGQTRLLQKWLPRIGGWRWLTLLGGFFGFIVAVGVHLFGYALFGGVLVATAEGAVAAYILWAIVMAVYYALGIGLGFLTLSFFQWLVLQDVVPKAHQWMWSNAIASVLSSFVGLISGLVVIKHFMGDITLDQLAPSMFVFLVYVILTLGFVVSWFLFHGLTGLTMARLLAKVPLRESRES